MELNKDVKVIKFEYSDSGRVYAILEPQETRLGFKIQGRPYLGKIYNINSVYNPVYRVFDYCDNEISTCYSKIECSNILYEKWLDFGMGAKILYKNIPFCARISCDLDLPVMASSKSRAKEWILNNKSEWEDILIESLDIDIENMKETHFNNWSENVLFYGKGPDMFVKEAKNINIKLQEEEIRKTILEDTQ